MGKIIGCPDICPVLGSKQWILAHVALPPLLFGEVGFVGECFALHILSNSFLFLFLIAVPIGGSCLLGLRWWRLDNYISNNLPLS